MSGSSLKARLMKGGIEALLIKVGAAGLQFLTYLVLARAMSPEDYGIFGFGVSLATLLAVAGSFGQRMLSLRYLPLYIAEEKTALATGRMRDGFVVVTLGTALLSAAVALGLPLVKPEMEFGVLALSGLLALTFAWAEYVAFALRAYGCMTLALAPRDVICWVLVILAALPSMLGLLPQFDAGAAILLLAGLLAGTVLVQTLMHSATRPQALLRDPAERDWATWLPVSWGLWGMSVVHIAAPNLAVVIMGLLLSPKETGALFAALRIAMLLNLFLLAGVMVGSPTISRLHHEGRHAELRRICASIALMSSAAAGVILIGLIVWGGDLLRLFGGGFESSHDVLLIVAGAQFVNTLTGPSSVLLELTGHERAAFRMLTGVNLLSIMAMVPMTLAFGAVGAATCLALSIAGWNIQAVLYARRRIGIDPSVAGLFFHGRQASA